MSKTGFLKGATKNTKAKALNTNINKLLIKDLSDTYLRKEMSTSSSDFI